jgi:hypothetical protein
VSADAYVSVCKAQTEEVNINVIPAKAGIFFNQAVHREDEKIEISDIASLFRNDEVIYHAYPMV